MTSADTNAQIDSRNVLARVLDEAKRAGATAAEADIGTGHGLSVTVRRGEVETIEHQRDKGLGITVYIGRRKGSAGSTDFSERAIAEIVASACAIARFASEDECAGLIDPRYLASKLPDLDLHHPWHLPPEEAIEIASACEAAALGADPRISNSDGTALSTYSGYHAYANSHGFSGGWDWSSHTLDCTVIAEDGSGMQRDGWHTRSRDAHDMENMKAVGLTAAARTVARLNPRRLSTRRAPVVFEAPVAGGLFSAFLNAISGAALYRKASFLLDSLGKEVFAECVTLREEPHLRKGAGSAAFDGDGMATRSRTLIDRGVLQSYLLSAYSARKLGMEPTGNAGGVHNLIVEPGTQDLAAILKSMNTGLLVTDLIGFGVNQVTGDYSRGASGYWVEGGEIRYPVEEITIAGNLKEMYKRIAATGNDVDARGNIRTGSVLIEDMTIAGA